MKIGGGIPAIVTTVVETAASTAQQAGEAAQDAAAAATGAAQDAAAATAGAAGDAGERIVDEFESVADGGSAMAQGLFGLAGLAQAEVRGMADARAQAAKVKDGVKSGLQTAGSLASVALGQLARGQSQAVDEAQAKALAARKEMKPVVEAAGVVAAVVVVAAAVAAATFTFGAGGGLVAVGVIGAGAAVGGARGAAAGAGDPLDPDLAGALRGGVKGAGDGGKAAADLLVAVAGAPLRLVLEEARRRAGSEE